MTLSADASGRLSIRRARGGWQAGGWGSLANAREAEGLAAGCEAGLSPDAEEAWLPGETTLQRKIQTLDLVLLGGKAGWLGSAGFPLLHLCSSALSKHQCFVFQRGVVFVEIPVCLGGLHVWEAAGPRLWEALAAPETT